MRRLLTCLALVLGSPAAAHEVRVETSRQTAAVIRLTYADGQPFAFEAFEIYLPGNAVPEQVGRTTARGEVVFLSSAQTDWRLKAYSADGHGVDQMVRVAVAANAEAPQAGVATAPARAWSLLAGAGILFGLFGLLQLFVRSRKT